MRLFVFLNNWYGLQIAKYLVANKESIIGLGISRRKEQKNVEEIIKTLGLSRDQIYPISALHSKKSLKKIVSQKPDLAVLSGCGYILKPEFLNIFPKGVINIHDGYLPHNRGKHANTWSFINGTPAGVTMHFAKEGVDEGDIIKRIKIPITPLDTAGSLYKRTIFYTVKIFTDTWPLIKAGKIKAIKQQHSLASYHLAKNVNLLNEIDLKKSYSGRELIDLIRARNIQGKTFSYFYENGKKIYVFLSLSDKPELESKIHDLDFEFEEFSKKKG